MQTTLKSLNTGETAHLTKNTDGTVHAEMTDFRGDVTREKNFVSVEETRDWFRNDGDWVFPTS